jgi:predicted NBD/HSP70 family sugar kinase
LGGDVQNETFVVADVGATFVRVALARSGQLGPITKRRIAELPRDERMGIVDSIAEMLRQTVANGWGGDSGPGGPPIPAAVGIGIAEAVDDRGSLHSPLSFGVPGGTCLRDRISAALGVPTAIDNDANMAALGELVYGIGRGLRDFLLLTLGTNLGLGIVANGELYRGAHGGAGEVGLMLVPSRTVEGSDLEGERRVVIAERFGVVSTGAPVGYTWIEELVGGRALSESLAASRSDGRLAERGTPSQPRPRVLQEAAAGDQSAQEIVRRGVEGWSYAIANLVALFDPAAIIIAGGLGADFEPFLDSLRQRVAAISRASPDILSARLGAIGGLIGAQVAASCLMGPERLKERLDAGSRASGGQAV